MANNGYVEPLMGNSETVELGVDLLGALNEGELSLAELLDRIETLTTNPATTRSIIDTAERRGVIHRENGVVRTTTGSGINLQHDVVRREGEFDCRRCGATLSTGYFLPLDSGDLGPFGPTCIEFVLDAPLPHE